MSVEEANTGIARKQLGSIRIRIYLGIVFGFLLAGLLDLVITKGAIPAYIWYPLFSGLGVFLFIIPFALFDKVNLALLQKDKG